MNSFVNFCGRKQKSSALTLKFGVREMDILDLRREILIGDICMLALTQHLTRPLTQYQCHPLG